MTHAELEQKLLSVIQLEKSLLSALMLEGGEAIPEVAEILSPADFYRPEHKIIYGALLKLNSKNVPLNVLLVERELGEDLKKVTRRYLFGLLELEYTTARARHYALKIKEQSTLRRLAEIGSELKNLAQNERGTSEEILADTEKKLTDLVTRTEKKVMSANDHILETVSRLMQPLGTLSGISTGFVSINVLTCGLKRSDLIILAARPSMGKTALALNIAMNAAESNTVLIFSLEMSKEQIGDRLMSAESKINAMRIQKHTFTEAEYNSLLTAADSLAKRKYFIDDARSLTLAQMKNKAARIKREHGLDLIVVDYIQLINCGNRYAGNRVQEVSELSRGLKCLAGDLDVPVLALSQLNRNVELRADKRPQLSDLRDSGSIEQDADIVMMLHRDDYYEHDGSVTAELIIAKNRNGATGIAPLKFEKEYLLFSDLTEADLK